MFIPQDLRDFLCNPENRHLKLAEGEVRDLIFLSAEELRLQKFVVEGCELHLNGPLKEDSDQQREYEGYSLIQQCNDYSPEGVLVWFPQLNSYGSADTDHQRIIIYPSVTWTDIIRDPTWYINGQWYPDRVAHEEVNPWL